MKKGYKVLLIIFSIIVILVVAGIIALKSIETRLGRLVDMEMPKIDLSEVPDGSHMGEYSSFPVMAKVNVIVKNNQIISVELLSYRHGQNMKLDELPDRIVQAQSLDVDAVSGATLTSKTVLLAVERALKGESEQ